jgi:hypothetical protein
MPNTMPQRTSQTTLFLCPDEICDMRFKSTYGRTQHICAKHPNFGTNEPESQSDDTNRDHRSIDSSPSSHTSQLDQADEHMVIDADPPPTGIVSDDFLQPPMTYSPFSSPAPFDDLLPFSTSQPPAIHPHDECSDADDIESTGRSHATSPFLDDPSHADTADESATGAFTDYHLILNGKFIHLKLSALY